MPSLAHIRSWLPLAAIPLAALAILLALGGDRARFQRDGGFHHELSAKNLAIAENMSPNHNFRLATRIWRLEDGGFEYGLYGRFPIGGYFLIKLAGLPFRNDLAASLLAARVLMLAMFCGAALAAHLALARIAGSRWIALAAVAAAFSGFYALHYADAVASEASCDLFGAALTFHGMVVFAQEGRFRQLLAKTCLALLLGWHLYALILPFALWGFGGEALAVSRSVFSSGRGGARAALSALRRLALSRYAALAAVSILVGSALLGFNLANEYAAFGGEVPPAKLPTARSALNRTSLGDDGFLQGYARTLADSRFWGLQFMRAGAASVPYALAPSLGDGQRESPEVSTVAAGVGVLALGAALGGLALVRKHRVLMAILALLGFLWAIPMKGVSAFDLHYYEGIYHIGIPLTIIAAALMGARAALGARWGNRLAAAAGAGFAVVFALSVFYESRLYEERGVMGAKLDMAALSELREMRDAVRGGDVLATSDIAAYVGGLWRYGVDYALGGTTFVSEHREIPHDFVISRYRIESFNPLTPDNRYMFLYGADADPDDLRSAERGRLEASEPAARAEFDVYLADGALRYLKTDCSLEDARAFFFLHVFPADAARFLGEGDSARFRGMNFGFAEAGKAFDGDCMATAILPDYPIAAIRTGQYASDRRRASADSAWQVSITPPPSPETLAIYESAYQAVADGSEPAARTGFDLHLTENALIYLKQPCAEEDARGRFWLSVHPANAGDLPAERREMGHESLNFDFEPPIGVVFNGKCMAARRLPDYAIDRIETGQDADGGRVWSTVVEIGD